LGIGSRPATIAVHTPVPHTVASPSPGKAGPYAGPLGDDRVASAVDRRVVMEAAQRLRTPMNKIRQRVAAGELVYDPDERRLVEATPTVFGEDSGDKERDRATNLSDPSDDTKLGTGESAPPEYLTVPEAARELGESVPDVLGRIGERELKWERISGMVKVRRQDVLATRARQAPTPPRSSRPAGRDTESRSAEAGNGGPEPETAARNWTEELQKRAATLSISQPTFSAD